MSTGEILCLEMFIQQVQPTTGESKFSKFLKKTCQVLSLNLSKALAEVSLFYEWVWTKALLLDGVIRPPILYIAVVHVITGILCFRHNFTLLGTVTGKNEPQGKTSSSCQLKMFKSYVLKPATKQSNLSLSSTEYSEQLFILSIISL